MASDPQGTELYQWLEEREETSRHSIEESDTEVEAEYWHGQYDLVRTLQDKIDGGVIGDDE